MNALPQPTLMLVTDRHLAGGEDALVEAVAAAVDGGVNVVQLREKDLDSQALSLLAGRLRKAIGGRALLIINSDAAVANDADGLHLPEGVVSARPDDGRLVGRSVHSVEAAQRAEREGADYAIAGPIFETASHPGQAPAGVRFLSEVANVISVPVIAIGGVTTERIPEIMTAGVSGVAVVSAILSADSPKRAAMALREALNVVPVGKR